MDKSVGGKTMKAGMKRVLYSRIIMIIFGVVFISGTNAIASEVLSPPSMLMVPDQLSTEDLRQRAGDNLAWLQSGMSLDYQTIPIFVQEIQEAIDSTAITWEELKLSPAQLEDLRKKSIIASLNFDINILLRIPGYNHQEMQLIFNHLAEALEKGDVAWSDLVCNQEQIKQVRLANLAKNAEETLKFLRQNKQTIDPSHANNLVGDIRQALAEKATTLKKLGVIEKELAQLANPKKEKEKKKPDGRGGREGFRKQIFRFWIVPKQDPSPPVHRRGEQVREV